MMKVTFETCNIVHGARQRARNLTFERGFRRFSSSIFSLFPGTAAVEAARAGEQGRGLSSWRPRCASGVALGRGRQGNQGIDRRLGQPGRKRQQVGGADREHHGRRRWQRQASCSPLTAMTGKPFGSDSRAGRRKVLTERKGPAPQPGGILGELSRLLRQASLQMVFLQTSPLPSSHRQIEITPCI